MSRPSSSAGRKPARYDLHVSVAIATCAALPDGDEDAPLMRDALASLGIESLWQSWSDPSVDWAAFDVVVLRSTWDYTADLDAFLAWAEGLTRLLNPAAVVAWNTDKTYLRTLADAGIAIVPTTYAAPGRPIELPPADEFVVKPSVGAGSRGAGRFDASAADAAVSHAVALQAAGRTVMIQPYLDQVDSVGETALVYLDGRFSHAIAKDARLPPATANSLDRGPLYVQERIAAREPTSAELAIGADVVAEIERRFGTLLYARVDLLPTSDGPVLLELELIEPSLFLGYAPGAADQLAEAIQTRLR